MQHSKVPTLEQQKILWEWCGFSYDYWGDKLSIIYPDNQTIADMSPIVDLNNLFKWAVPKVRKQFHIHFHSTNNKTEWRIVLSNANETIYGRDNDPAMALCLAISKVIDNE